MHTAAGIGVINCPILLSKVAQIKETHNKGVYSCLCYGLNNNRHGSGAFLFLFLIVSVFLKKGKHLQ